MLSDDTGESHNVVKRPATATCGRYKVLADKYEGKRFNSPNDRNCRARWRYLLHRSQALFGERRETGDFISGCESPGRKKGGALGMRDLTQPNGPAFSLDGEHFYVDDSQGKNIRVSTTSRRLETLQTAGFSVTKRGT